MKMTLAQYQTWLNSKGASLVVDGKRGPATRAATFQVFTNLKAPAITDNEIEALARRLGGTAKQLRAVSIVESAGGGFNDQGQPKALYERHYAWKRLRLNIPLLSNPAPGGYTIDADKDGLNDSWEKLADCAMINPVAAFESASFGKFQIMGAWGEKLGWSNAIEFAYALSRTEEAHYEALFRYIMAFGMVAAFRALSTDPDACRMFAKGFNGPKYERYDYHNKLARAMR